MSKRKSLTEVYSSEGIRPHEQLYRSSDSKDSIDKISGRNNDRVSSQEENYRRQTYYITDDIRDALAIKKALEDKDLSQMVREALMNYIEDKYFKMVEEKKNKK